MLLEAVETDVLSAMEALVDRLDVLVDGDRLARVIRLRETLLAKTMAPLRVFDELLLYQLSKASSSAQFLERCAGSSPREARSMMFLVRKLKAMPLTEAAWLAGTLTSGQVHAIADNVTKRLAERFTADEAVVLGIIAGLDVKDTETAIQKWVHYSEASLDDVDPKPPREDEFFHSEAGGRYFSKGSFGSVTGKVINDAIGLAETDNPRDDDTRSPAERRGEALADVCGFYLDYQNRVTADPDADAPKVPKKRNLPHLIAVSMTTEMRNHSGAQLLDGPHIDHQAFEALSCTAQLLRLVLDENGAIRSYQMLPASVTDALFQAIAARDQGCRWPGCHKKPIHCDVHHLHHQENGGVNSPSCAAPPQRTGGSAAERSCVSPWNPTEPSTSLMPTAAQKPPNPQSDNPAHRGTDQCEITTRRLSR
jgi:hypothetical protein